MCNSSKLYYQNTFYTAFERDLRHCKQELIIESPFITTRRIKVLLPLMARLRKRGVSIVVNTRNPVEHDGDYYYQSLAAVTSMQNLGILPYSIPSATTASSPSLTERCFTKVV